MLSLYGYTDYRKYLRDFYAQRKGKNPSYSYRLFAKKAGLGSPNYFKLVMDGHRNLTHRNVRKFAQGLGLSEIQSQFFENLVFFNQAKDDSEAAFFKRNLDLLRNHDERGLLNKDQYEVLSKWYPVVIKELILLSGFNPSPKWIAERLDFQITPQQAKEAVDTLLRLGLIRKLGANLQITQQSLQTPDVATSDAVARYHQQMLRLAEQAIEGQDSNERCFSALTFAVSKTDLPEASRRIHEFRNQLDTLFAKRKKYDAVYQLGIQLFRLDTDGS